MEILELSASQYFAKQKAWNLSAALATFASAKKCRVEEVHFHTALRPCG